MNDSRSAFARVGREHRRRDEEVEMTEHASMSEEDRRTRTDEHRPNATEVPEPRADSSQARAVTVDARTSDPAPNPTDPTGPSGTISPGGHGSTAETARPRAASTGHETWRPGPHGMDRETVRSRWADAQSRFVDDPHQAVREADALAAEVADTVVAEIEARRSALRSTWGDGGDTDTETLRVSLRDYRSFVEGLTGDGT